MSEPSLKRRKAALSQTNVNTLCEVVFKCNPIMSRLVSYLRTYQDLVSLKRVCKVTNAFMSLSKVNTRIKRIESILKNVKRDGFALRHVSDQTEDVCLTAVKQNGWALQVVDKQTREMCLAAVKQDGSALRFVNEQTEEICLAAVKQEGYALRFVNEQTEEICLAAVKQDLGALQDVKEQTRELCLVAVKRYGRALKWVHPKFKYVFE